MIPGSPEWMKAMAGQPCYLCGRPPRAAIRFISKVGECGAPPGKILVFDHTLCKRCLKLDPSIFEAKLTRENDAQRN